MASLVKGKKFEGKQVFKTKTGQAFIKKANGQALFIKNSAVGLAKAKPPKKTKAKTASKSKKSSNPSNPPKKGKRRSTGMKGIATLIGATGSALSMANIFKKQRERGRSIGGSIVYTIAGIDTDEGGINEGEIVGRRLVSSWGGLAAGTAVSIAASKLGVNRRLPKGINL